MGDVRPGGDDGLEPQRFSDAGREVVWTLLDLAQAISFLAHVGLTDGRENAVKVDAETDGHAVGGEHDVTQGVGNFHNVRGVLGGAATGLAARGLHPHAVVPQLVQFFLNEAVSLHGLAHADGLRGVAYRVAKLAVEVDNVLLDGECQGCGPFDGYNVQVEIYDQDGKPMDEKEFEKIPFKKKVIAASTVMDGKLPIRVLTMWDGIDLSGGEAPVPMVYSTLVYSEHRPNMCTAYPKKEMAIMGHHAMIGFLAGHGCTTNKFVVGLKMIRFGLTNPQTLLAARINTFLYAAIVLIQLMTITMSVIRWDLDWADAFSALIGAGYAWLMSKALKAWKRLKRERDEERRVKKDREEFERIVAPYTDHGSLEA